MRRWWLYIGVKAGWISLPYCQTHDGGWEYMSEETRQEWEAGGDPCHTVMILLDSDQRW
jgi:hypothetical protein